MTPDELSLAVLASGLVTVNSLTGVAYTTRRARGLLGHCREIGTTNTKGYRVATLHWKGERKQVKLHRLVWLAVHGSIPDGLIPDHVNRIKGDNRIANLRLVDTGGNAANRRPYAGKGNPAAKLTKERAQEIRNASGSYAERASLFGISKSLVAQIARGEVWI